jgi:hypothetical protein
MMKMNLSPDLLPSDGRGKNVCRNHGWRWLTSAQKPSKFLHATNGCSLSHRTGEDQDEKFPKKSRHEALNHQAIRDWIRPTGNCIKRRMQSLSLLPGGEGQDEGERYNQL